MYELTDDRGNPILPPERPTKRAHGPEKRPSKATREKARAKRKDRRR